MKAKIELHEKAIEILEGIKCFENGEESCLADIRNTPNELTQFHKIWKRKAEIQRMAADRMKLRYINLMKEL